MLFAGPAEESGQGNPMVSRNGKKTICMYTCFKDNRPLIPEEKNKYSDY